MDVSLIQKYNIPGPRYTSYPTVPYWDPALFNPSVWSGSFLRSFAESNADEGISLYIHLPFCDRLCTFCACHKRITTRHSVERPYIDALLQEWALYREQMPAAPRIKALHLGGGTPSFFSPEHLALLLDGLFKEALIAPEPEFSFEGHPNNTLDSHLQTLYTYGFRRVSFGVQDYDPRVQEAIHRVQTYEQVAAVTRSARDTGYASVSHDLVFGLPFQTRSSMSDTIKKTIDLQPHRIAYYAYAHVPWIKGVGQRGYREQDLPAPELKRQLYESGKEMLEAAGYVEIGMDHFTLRDDHLYQHMLSGRLHRNFMGYTTATTQLTIGLGMSAISDAWYAYAQNEKNLEAYMQRVARRELPLITGHVLTDEDLVIRWHILNLMCRFHTSWASAEMQVAALPEVVKRLEELASDGLVATESTGLRITDKGRAFVRNVAMAFDLRLIRKQPQTQLFSMTI